MWWILTAVLAALVYALAALICARLEADEADEQYTRERCWYCNVPFGVAEDPHGFVNKPMHGSCWSAYKQDMAS